MEKVFKTLNAVDVSEKTEKKSNLSYLPWAWAWSETVKRFPDAQYEVREFDGRPYMLDPSTGYMIFTSVTIENTTHKMWLPVMNEDNKAMKNEPYTYRTTRWVDGVKKAVDKTVSPATMTDINKTIMRCLTKNLAMFGLGLYIYAGEDLPETDNSDVDTADVKPKVNEIDRPVVKVPIKEPAKPKAETKPDTPAVTVATAETSPPVQPAAQAKTPITQVELVIGSENWTRVLAYIAKNKQLGFEKIVEALSSKYTMGPGIKKQLKQQIEA
jgi:hypothetical protein